MIYEDVVPARTQQVRKQVWDPDRQQFQEVRFVRVFMHTRQDLDRARDHHRQSYGEPHYQGSWWHDDHSIWLRESLATWWLLKNG